MGVVMERSTSRYKVSSSRCTTDFFLKQVRLEQDEGKSLSNYRNIKVTHTLTKHLERLYNV